VVAEKPKEVKTNENNSNGNIFPFLYLQRRKIETRLSYDTGSCIIRNAKTFEFPRTWT
jgi:hypothetical protein